MDSNARTENIRQIVEQAEVAYAEFERRMRALEEERLRAFEQELADIDRVRIEKLRKKIAAT